MTDPAPSPTNGAPAADDRLPLGPVDEFAPRNMVRNALKDGLALGQSTGTNPFALGFIGSTDSHSATPGQAEEDNYVGHLGRRDAGYRNVQDHFFSNPGGHAVVWAEENSRDAIFAGMRRKETYATSGTRPEVRFFGGPDLDLVSFGEMHDSFQMVRGAAPGTLVLADGDHGHGNAMNVQRTVRAYGRAGAAGVLIEDKVTPRALTAAGKPCLPREEARMKIRAAVDAAKESGILILARTDCRPELHISSSVGIGWHRRSSQPPPAASQPSGASRHTSTRNGGTRAAAAPSEAEPDAATTTSEHVVGKPKVHSKPTNRYE